MGEHGSGDRLTERYREKSALENMLVEAAANTARMQNGEAPVLVPVPATALDEKPLRSKVGHVPTADQIARAVVAAAMETGEDPLTVGAHPFIRLRLRHYVIHALENAFPRTPIKTLCGFVGLNKNATVFYKASLREVVGRPRKALWWDDAALARVIAAVRDQ